MSIIIPYFTIYNDGTQSESKHPQNKCLSIVACVYNYKDISYDSKLTTNNFVVLSNTDTLEAQSSKFFTLQYVSCVSLTWMLMTSSTLYSSLLVDN